MSSQKKVYVVRAKPHGHNREKDFYEGIISIGWPTKESLKGKSWDEIKRILKPDYKDIKTVNVTQIYNFVNIPIGSIILTPMIKKSDIFIFETTSEYEYVPEWADDNIGNPHTIKAQYIKTVERSAFSEIINRALKSARKTVTEFTKYSDEIQYVIKNYIKNTDDYEEKESNKKNEAEIEAIKALKELLKSSNEEIRLKAALAIINQD